MRTKNSPARALTGLLIALLVALFLPATAMAVPPAPAAAPVVPQYAPDLSIDALEVFAQETHVLTPRSTGAVTSDTTAFYAGVPQGTTVLFVIEGTVGALDAANGEWQLGSQPVTAYESAETTFTGTAGVGDVVRIVGKRTLTAGPIVAQFISLIDPAPQAVEPAVVSTAYLFNGTVTAATADTWTVTPPAPASPVDFNILPDISPLGPTVIEVGLDVGSAVTVEYVITGTPTPPQPPADVTYDALEVFAQEAHVLTPRSTGAIASDTTTIDAGALQGTTVLFVIEGTVGALDAANGEWQLGSQPVTAYESDQTTFTGTAAVGDVVRIVGKRTLTAGPIVAQYISLIDPAPQAMEPAVVATALLFNGTVTAATADTWTVTPPAPADPVAFNILPEPSPLGPTIIDVGLAEGSAVTVEYVITPIPANPPEVTTGDATGIGTDQATLNGALVSRGGAAAVDVYFEYGETAAYGSTTAPQTLSDPGAFSATITGLQPDTLYHFRAKADGEVQHGGDSGLDMTFTTSAAPVVTPPAVQTNSATNITSSSAMLNGNLTGMGTATSVGVSFEWGTTSGGPYPNTTAIQLKAEPGTFAANITGLAQNTTYFFRARANGGTSGSGVGGQMSFVTSPVADNGGGGDDGGGNGGPGGGSDVTGGAGSSGPGGGQEEPEDVAVEGMTGDDVLKVDSSGKSQSRVKLSNSGPGKPSLEVPAGTTMKSKSGEPLTSMTVAPPVTTPPAPPQNAVVVAQDFGPDGATFDPPITLTLSFDPAELPAGTNVADLVIAFWNGSEWEVLETTVNADGTLSAQVSHFTTFAVLAQVTPMVTITAPVDGATLAPGNITVVADIDNFERVQPGGAPVPGQGHVHYYMDVDIPTTPGQPAVTAAGTYKVTTDDEVVWANVPPGEHTFGVQLVNNNHTPLEPPVTATVTVTVRSPQAAPTPTPALTPTAVAPTPTPAPTGAPQPTATPEPTAAPQPTATAAPQPAATPQPTATTAPQPTPTPQPTLQPTPTAGPPAQTNWGLIVGIIVAAVVVIGVAVLLVRRRTTA